MISHSQHFEFGTLMPTYPRWSLDGSFSLFIPGCFLNEDWPRRTPTLVVLSGEGVRIRISSIVLMIGSCPYILMALSTFPGTLENDCALRGSALDALFLLGVELRTYESYTPL